MTDIRDIYSTHEAYKYKIKNVPEPFVAELLLSLILSLIILSGILFLRWFVDTITIGMYAQFVTLILPVALTFVRRKCPKLLTCLLLHLAVPVAFYFILTLIPVTGFGVSKSNKFYLGMILAAYTLFSALHRLRPKIRAGDSQFIALPACIHPLLYLFFYLTESFDLINNLTIHVVLILVMYIVMRQIAVFDEKYYHSIRRSSKPAALLKKQNYKTAVGLIVVFAISVLVLLVFPVEEMTKLVLLLIYGIAELIKRFLNLGGDLELIYGDPSEKPEFNQEAGEIEPWMDIAGKVLIVLILIGLVLLILNGIRLLIQNAPKIARAKEMSEDENLVDTIEDIQPEKRQSFTRGHNFGKGYERRIRKQFYDKTRRAMKKGLPVGNSSTPGQIEAVLLKQGDKEISSLRKEYEKVRYGR